MLWQQQADLTEGLVVLWQQQADLTEELVMLRQQQADQKAEANAAGGGATWGHGITAQGMAVAAAAAAAT